jgi:hypothetical protein
VDLSRDARLGLVRRPGPSQYNLESGALCPSRSLMPSGFKRSLLGVALAAAALAGLATAPLAQIPGDKIKIGVLSDFSGPFADQVGKGSLVGAQLAA